MKIAKLPTSKPVLKPVNPISIGDKGPIKVKPLRVQSGIRLQSIQSIPTIASVSTITTMVGKTDPSPVVLQKFKLKKKESS